MEGFEQSSQAMADPVGLFTPGLIGQTSGLPEQGAGGAPSLAFRLSAVSRQHTGIFPFDSRLYSRGSSVMMKTSTAVSSSSKIECVNVKRANW
jgi:hypothetical protein